MAQQQDEKVYDRPGSEMDDFEKSFAGDDATTSGSDKIAAANQERAQLESAVAAPSATTSGSQIAAGKKDDDTVGKGFNPAEKDDAKKPVSFGDSLKGKSNFKKRVAVAGAIAGGSAMGGALMFFVMLPLKINSFVNEVESRFSAVVQTEVEHEVDGMFTEYIKKHVLPSLHAGCPTTQATKSCVAPISGTSPIDKLYDGWRQNNIEGKLASQYNIEFAKRGNTYYMYAPTMSPDGVKMGTLSELQADGKNIFDYGSPATKKQLKEAVSVALKDASKWDKSFFRYSVISLLKNKEGVKFCVVFCDADGNHKISGTLKEKSLLFQGYLIEKMGLSDEYSLILQCIISGGCSTDVTESSDGTGIRKSDFTGQLQDKLVALSLTEGGEEKVADVVARATGFNASPKQYLVKTAVKFLVGQFGGDAAAGAAAGDASTAVLEKAAGPIAWVTLSAGVLNFISTAGPKLRVMAYAINSAAAIKVFMSYRSLADEVQSGHGDIAVLGGAAHTLSMGGSNATDTPLYQKLFYPSGDQSAFLDQLLPGDAYAATTTGTTAATRYTCEDDDNKPVPTGKYVCGVEDFAKGTGWATGLTNAFNDIPAHGLISALAGAIQTIANLPSDAIGSVLSAIPGFSDLTAAIGSLAGPLVTFVFGQMIPNPFAQNSGGRNGDMAIGGEDAAMNETSHYQLGGRALSSTETASITSEQLAEQKDEFDSQPLFARMFSTSSPYSLISQLALDMPTDLLTTTTSGLASLLSNPFTKMGSIFTSFLSPGNAFAAAPMDDPFGIIQYGRTDSDLAAHDKAVAAAGGYGNWAAKNCSDMTVVNNAWANSAQESPATGEGVNTTTNDCMLYNGALTSGGAMAPSLIPPGDSNE